MLQQGDLGIGIFSKTINFQIKAEIDNTKQTADT